MSSPKEELWIQVYNTEFKAWRRLSERLSTDQAHNLGHDRSVVDSHGKEMSALDFYSQRAAAAADKAVALFAERLF